MTYVNLAFWLFVALCAGLLVVSAPMATLGVLLAFGLMLLFAACMGQLANWREK